MKASRFQDLLGELVERFPRTFLKLGNLETFWFADDLENITIDRPIYITGLARSGTTILLEMLADNPSVVTHQYRDFPLLHIPIWWNWFLERAKKKEYLATERSHKDGLYVTPRSPEAMEEILWMAFFENAHAPATHSVLDQNTSNPLFESYYRDHIRKLLLARKGTRYAAKGNYNISRMLYIAEIFDDARFVIAVRDPAAHISSLIKQHRLFVEEGKKDQRVLDYMRRVGHFEFGLDRRPIMLTKPEGQERVLNLWDSGEEVRGWAAYWAYVYGYVADLLETSAGLSRQAVIVHYGDLCRSPVQTLEKIYRHCELKVDPYQLKKQAAQLHTPTYYSPNFSMADRETIEEETSIVHSRLRHLIS